MKFFEFVLLLSIICLFGGVSGDAPGDEHRLCYQDFNHSESEMVLLDSNNYINLLSGFFPPPVWKTQSYQPENNGWTSEDTNEICKQTVQVCDYRSGPRVYNWLYTQYIDYHDSKEVFVAVTFDFSDCLSVAQCTKPYVDVYYLSTNGSCPEEEFSDEIYYRHFGRLIQQQQGPLSLTLSFDRPSSDEGFYLGFQDTGTCGTISRVRVFCKVCASKVDGLTYYPSLPLPPQNSQEPNIAYAYCAYNSYNSLASGYKAHGNGQCEYGARCECRLGYEEVITGTDARCQACPRGTYRSASDTSCQMCPSNTVQTGRAVAECSCVNGFYRTAMEGPDVACTAPPSGPCLNLVVSDSSNFNDLTLTWNRPNFPGREDYYYNVYYSRLGEEGTFIKDNQVPYINREFQVSYALTDLAPFTRYTIRVTVNNGVSNQDPAGIGNRTCEITVLTTPTEAAIQVDMLSGLGVWNSSDDSTQYQIRYKRTKDSVDDGDSLPLEMYFVDSGSKFMVEVRPLSSEGDWSTPITVQMKALCHSPTTTPGPGPTDTGVLTTERPMATQCKSTDLYSFYEAYDYFEDPCALSIHKIVITYFLHHVSSIEVTYNLPNGTRYTAPRHGYDFGRFTVRKLVEINFDEGEEIVAVTGAWCAQYDFNDSPLTWFKFITMKPNGDHHVYGPYGGGPVRGERFVVNANVVSFFGYEHATGAVYAIGFKYKI